MTTAICPVCKNSFAEWPGWNSPFCSQDCEDKAEQTKGTSMNIAIYCNHGSFGIERKLEDYLHEYWTKRFQSLYAQPEQHLQNFLSTIHYAQKTLEWADTEGESVGAAVSKLVNEFATECDSAVTKLLLDENMAIERERFGLQVEPWARFPSTWSYHVEA